MLSMIGRNQDPKEIKPNNPVVVHQEDHQVLQHRNPFLTILMQSASTARNLILSATRRSAKQLILNVITMDRWAILRNTAKRQVTSQRRIQLLQKSVCCKSDRKKMNSDEDGNLHQKVANHMLSTVKGKKELKLNSIDKKLFIKLDT